MLMPDPIDWGTVEAMGPIFCSPLLMDENSSNLLDRIELDELRQPSNF